MEPLVKCEITTETVVCAESVDCPVHPESYNPRIFVTVMHPVPTCYEVLQTGWFLEWKKLPKEGSPDYMLFVIDDLHCFSKIKAEKHPQQAEWEAEVQ